MDRLNTLAFEIVPSPKTNDHEVVVLVDGQRFLRDKYMGLDPADFFGQFAKPEPIHSLHVGRCVCGCIGCSDYFVAVHRGPLEVRWGSDGSMRFSRAQYEEAVRAASIDISWEDQERRAERLVGEVLSGCRDRDGFIFKWASARFAPGRIKLVFARNGDQKVLDFAWDEVTDESAIRGAQRLRDDLSKH